MCESSGLFGIQRHLFDVARNLASRHKGRVAPPKRMKLRKNFGQSYCGTVVYYTYDPISHMHVVQQFNMIIG